MVSRLRALFHQISPGRTQGECTLLRVCRLGSLALTALVLGHLLTSATGQPHAPALGPEGASGQTEVEVANYHEPGAPRCAECHRGDPARGAEGGVVDGGALLAPGLTEVCLRCHEGTRGVPDVVGEDVNRLADRAGGWFTPPGENSPHGHDLAAGVAPRPSPLPAASRHGVTCVDCHHPHGNGRPRNLLWADGAPGSPTLGLFLAPWATGLAKYEAANVAYDAEPRAGILEASSICLSCHQGFGEGRGQHPAYSSMRGELVVMDRGPSSRSTDPAHWQGGEGKGFEVPRVRVVTLGARSYEEAQLVDARANAPFCLTCHKAHGSDQPFGIPWPAQGGVGPAGCSQCHNK